MLYNRRLLGEIGKGVINFVWGRRIVKIFRRS